MKKQKKDSKKLELVSWKIFFKQKAEITGTEKIIIKTIVYNSPEQLESLNLRYDVLRKPLGLKFASEKLKEEASEIHIAAFKNLEIIGILLLKTYENSKTVKMRQVAVKADLQSKGTGKKLVEFAEKWARQNNFSKIELHARLTAKDFYLKNNYEISGDEFEEVGIPHIKMFKNM